MKTEAVNITRFMSCSCHPAPLAIIILSWDSLLSDKVISRQCALHFNY